MYNCFELQPQRTSALLLQGLRASSDPESGFVTGRVSSAGSIPAGQHTSASRTTSQDLTSGDVTKSALTFDAVKSLASAGSWLQVLRAKLAGGGGSEGRDQLYSSVDETASLPGMPALQEEHTYQEPIRRSRSDTLHDRGEFVANLRRGGDLGTRPSTAGASRCSIHCRPVVESNIHWQHHTYLS